MKAATPPKEKLLAAAARLFYQHGYRAVGVDAIAEESGVGKMTLYRHFPSKEHLIVAYLNEADAQFWRWFDQTTGPFPGQPRQQLLAFFGAVQAIVTNPICLGCPFLNAAVDFPPPDHPGHRVALEHKRAARARFRELAEQVGARDPARVGDQLYLIMDAAFMAARMFGGTPDNPAANIVEAVQQLIDTQCEAVG